MPRIPIPLLLSALLLAFAGRAAAQLETGSGDTGDAEAAARLDSLRRVISVRILSDAEKKDIRSCDRDKAKFLKDARAADPAYAEVDKALNQAKLSGANPNDPSVMALMEKKFAYEKSFDQRFYAAARGKQCGEADAKRAKALARALEKDKQYQSLLRKAHGGATAGSL